MWAIASSHETAGLRGIVRVTGPDATNVAQTLFAPAEVVDWPGISAARRIPGTVHLAVFGEVPCDLFLWPTQRSYTRQPTAEFHSYGCIPILQAIVEQTCQNGARLAQPGEFTMRSFLSGRIDLAQAEAVLGVIDAVNDREMQVGLAQMSGGLSQPLTRLRDTLMNLVADLEAGLDFVDEDIEFISQEQVFRALTDAENTIRSTLDRMNRRDSGGPLPRVLLRGEPNVGKSSLWNSMVDEGSAIVDSTAGTTRDYLTGTVVTDLGSFQLIDTAGVEEATTEIGTAMQEMSASQLQTADLVLLCIDASRTPSSWELEQLSNRDERTLVVLTKTDLPTHAGWDQHSADALTNQADPTSFRRLASYCCERLQALGGESGVVGNTAARCRESLRLALKAVERSERLALSQVGDELVSSELRTALDQLGLVVGAIYNDDILDRVFSRFCIGK